MPTPTPPFAPRVNRRESCPLARWPLMLSAAEPSDGAVVALAPASSSLPPLSRASTPAKRSCEARKASSRVPALPPMPALSFFRNCFTSDVLPWPVLPRPCPSCHPMPLSSFMPTLSDSSVQKAAPCRPAEPYCARNFFASPDPMVRAVACARRAGDGERPKIRTWERVVFQ
eukprot:scaffold11753_cov47-Phaeocystis_antarctica.AAC.2